ncbi:hypothetical protein [Polaromonas sp.]|uniref:hypothetical protein n=1 Tax=Polaromonas sp. TaxID=1869339 RepID=UPI002731BDDF|nr:hypothetical protein [Polaromonas sp.]MDP1742687.1 hypothetical protein [Polaromonas sp.]
MLDEVAALDPDKDTHELDDCLSALIRSPALSVLALGNWLGANAKLPLAKLLVHNLSVQYLAAETPVNLDLAMLQSSDAVLVAFRLCALATTPAFSLGWVLALLRNDETGVQTHALELLRHHIREYPHTTQRLLESMVPDLKTTLPVVAEVLSMLSKQSDAFEQAPRLKEFAMSREERIALQGLKLREQREIHRHAEQSSVLMQFVKQSHFKYSHETVVEFSAQGQTFEQSLSMQPHAVSVELPISERLDPQTGPLRRNRMWAGPTS